MFMFPGLYRGGTGRYPVAEQRTIFIIEYVGQSRRGTPRGCPEVGHPDGEGTHEECPYKTSGLGTSSELVPRCPAADVGHAQLIQWPFTPPAHAPARRSR